MKVKLLLFLLLPALGSAQSLSLEEILQKAEANFGLSSQTETYQNIHQLQQSSADKGKLPQLNLSAQATYQSDVTSVPINLPNMDIPTVPKDQYRATLNVNQMIYDGAAINSQKAVADAQLQVNQLKVANSKRELRQNVASVYFNVLNLQQTQKILSLKADELAEREKALKVATEQGVLLEANLQEFQAERIKLNAELEKLKLQEATLLQILSTLSGEQISASTNLQMPDQFNLDNVEFQQRSDLGLLTANQSVLDQQANLLDVKAKPKVFAFGTAGYGRPGLNMLDDQFAPYYIVGAKVTWDFWDWGATNQQKQMIGLQKTLLNTQKENLTTQIENEVANQLAAIQRLEIQLKADEEIIALRTSIKKAYGLQLDEGTLSATDYLQYLNAEQEAMLQKAKNEVALAQTKYSLQLTLEK